MSSFDHRYMNSNTNKSYNCQRQQVQSRQHQPCRHSNNVVTHVVSMSSSKRNFVMVRGWYRPGHLLLSLLQRQCRWLFMFVLILFLHSTSSLSHQNTLEPSVDDNNYDLYRQLQQIHPIGRDVPWRPGPHPHHTYNATTRTWTSSLQQQGRRREEEPKQANIRQYVLWKPEEISETVTKWSQHYSTILQVTTSQEAYQLPTAGGTEDCPYETNNKGCLNYILIIQDKMAHPSTSTSSKQLPDVLWSGELHGNERVGPTAVLEATQLLLDAAICESLPRRALQTTTDDPSVWEMELQRAQECRQELHDRGINDTHRKWLARLVSTRRIVVIPTANALGYYQNTREENRIDPNRDFPYDQTDPTACMQTIAGRTLNEIFRQHLFQLSLTFHGGMEVIGYEWGAPSYSKKKSPDDIAQYTIAQAYAQYAGPFANTPAYDFGPMNDLVYPVNGGMEDWAYAGSWDPDLVVPCAPITYGGYPTSQTTYDNSTLRVFNMLVETSNHKTPYEYELGTSLNIMTISATGNGHVARNIRLALLAVELVEPYVVIQSVNGVSISDDIVPSVVRGGGTSPCQLTKTMAVPYDSATVTVQWIVGGALTVDETTLFYTKWDTTVEAILDCEEQPDLTKLRPLLSSATMTSASTGTTKFSKKKNFEATVFSATLDVSKYEIGDTIAVIAMARVDQSWGKASDRVGDVSVGPMLGPQSHVVNARTNPNWYHSTTDGKKVIQGRLDWVSIPLTIVIKDYSDAIRVPAEEPSLRYNESQIMEHYDMSDHTDSTTGSAKVPVTTSGVSSSTSNRSVVPIVLIAMIATVGIIGFGGRTYLQHTMRYTHRERVREFIDDETAIAPGLKSVSNGTTNSTKRFSDNSYEDDEAVRAHGVELGTYT